MSKDYLRWMNAQQGAVCRQVQRRGRPLTKRELDAYKMPKRIKPIKPIKPF